jgi:hypothetical protein
MNAMDNSPVCERADDLVAFLYNEGTEHEARDFENHLHECSACRQELASFGSVRQSVTAWRDEALLRFVATPATTSVPQRSALAALRQFFDLSPLWLKAATGFAVLAFCVLAVLAFVKVPNNNVKVAETKHNPEAVYTAEDVNRLVKEAIGKQANAQQRIDTVEVSTPKQMKSTGSSQIAKSRRPLSRAEREQLAADLRLLTTRDDAGLNLISDRINR